MDEREGGRDVIRLAAIVYLVGTLVIIGIAYILPHSMSTAVVIVLGIWGVSVPVYIFIQLRRSR